MKPAILSMLVATKVMACAMVAALAVAAAEIRLQPVPASMSSLAEPPSGGYRRKVEDEVWRRDVI